ncbi:MAG: lysophospholipid acyltransferase family protein [Cohaesibacteraceae bacterium]
MATDTAADSGPSRLSIAFALIKLTPVILMVIFLGPVHLLVMRFAPHRWTFFLPRLWHKLVLWVLGVRVHVEGEPLANGPVLLTGNHVSWLDIPILGSIAPLRFISKDDVADWPIIGWLITFQKTLLVSRTRRQDTARTMAEMREALAEGDRLVLFPEGTSSDGGQVLPFRSALLGAVTGDETSIAIQPFALAYVRQGGLPIGRGERALLGWYGDLDLLPSFLHIIHGGVVDVAVVFGEPRTLEAMGGRKKAAPLLEADVRRSLARRLRSG